MGSDLLHDHQESGALWLAQRAAAILGDKPGLGKTRTILAALYGVGARRPLILAPAIAVSHWGREALTLGLDPPFVLSYDKAVRSTVSEIRAWTDDYDVLVADESHMLKHSTSKRTKLVFGKNGLADNADRFYAASGTPVPRHPGELWPMLMSVFPEVLIEHGIRTRTQFNERFLVIRRIFANYGYREKVVALKNTDEFKLLLSKIMLRRTLADINFDVPEVQWSEQVIDAGGMLAGAPDLPLAVQQAIARGEPLEQFLQDEHVARYRRRVGMAKAPAVVRKLVMEMEEGSDKVLVFAQHTDVLHILRDGLSQFGVAFVDGSVTGKARDAEIDRFQSDSRTRVFVGQNKACSLSATLTAAQRAVLVEPDWAADVNYQLGQRMARIGSRFQTCFGEMVSLAGTIDEAVVRQNVRETKMFEQMFGGS